MLHVVLRLLHRTTPNGFLDHLVPFYANPADSGTTATARLSSTCLRVSDKPAIVSGEKPSFLPSACQAGNGALRKGGNSYWKMDLCFGFSFLSSEIDSAFALVSPFLLPPARGREGERGRACRTNVPEGQSRRSHSC